MSVYKYCTMRLLSWTCPRRDRCEQDLHIKQFTFEPVLVSCPCHFKGALARNFWLFFSSKAPARSSDSYPKFVSTIKLNSPRYSNYSSLCFESVNVDLIFSSNYIQTFSILWLILAPFEYFIDNFSLSYPFKGARVVYVCLSWFDSFSAYWVNAEWDSPSTESTQSETPHQLS